MLKEILKARGIEAITDFRPEEWKAVRANYLDRLLSEEYGTPLPALTSLTTP